VNGPGLYGISLECWSWLLMVLEELELNAKGHHDVLLFLCLFTSSLIELCICLISVVFNSSELSAVKLI